MLDYFIYFQIHHFVNKYEKNTFRLVENFVFWNRSGLKYKSVEVLNRFPTKENQFYDEFYGFVP